MDCIYWLGKRAQPSTVVLVASPDVHPEMKLKVKLSAEVAFASADLLELKHVNGATKHERTNSIFSQAAVHVQEYYRVPWLWMEPDCVPAKEPWIDDLSQAYDNQPKRYMGIHVMDGEWKFLFRTAVYPFNAARELEKFCSGSLPFDRAASKTTLPRSTITSLIQAGRWTPDTVIPDTTALFRRDETGVLLEWLIEQSSGRPTPKRGRPKKPAIA